MLQRDALITNSSIYQGFLSPGALSLFKNNECWNRWLRKNVNFKIDKEKKVAKLSRINKKKTLNIFVKVVAKKDSTQDKQQDLHKIFEFEIKSAEAENKNKKNRQDINSSTAFKCLSARRSNYKANSLMCKVAIMEFITGPLIKEDNWTYRKPNTSHKSP